MALVTERFDALVTRARKEVDAGVLPSCQLAVGLDGEVVACEAIGDATIETRYVIFSETKALIAAVMWQLIAEGSVAIGDTIASHVPEFGANDKDTITVEQVMTHTSGFPRAPMGPPDWEDRAWRVERMASWRCNWEPGTRFEYHPTSAHWVLAELIARVDGRDHRDAVRARVIEPLGLERLALGVPADQQGDVAHLVASGEQPDADDLESVFGVREYDLGEVTPEALLMFDRRGERRGGCSGWWSGVDRCRHGALVPGVPAQPRRALDPDVLADGTGHIRTTLPDPILRTPANRTLGLIAAGSDGTSAYRGMGHNVSERAFGHNGAAGQIAWADPETGLSFCYLTNGIDRNFLREARRVLGISSRAALLTRPV